MRKTKTQNEIRNMTKGEILLVDDEKIVRESLGEWLTEAGYKVILAEDGEEALKIVAVKDVNVALVDLKLPGEYDGLEVLKRIKTEKDIPVIIITAYGTIENAVEAMKNGASDYVTKPFEPEDLEIKIDEVIKEIQKAWKEEEMQEAVRMEKKKPAKERQCIWAKAGVVSHRICLHDFDCASCEFAQSLMDKEVPVDEKGGFDIVRARLLKLPATERKCRYMLSEDVTFRLCTTLYECSKCEFDQLIQDIKQQKQEELARKVEKMKKKKLQ